MEALSEHQPPYRSAGTRAKLSVAFLGITGLVCLVTLVHYVSGFSVLDRAEDGLLTLAEADAFDSTTQALTVAYVVAFIATAVAFLAWLSRSVDNVPALGGGRPDFSPRWSIGWWFVPFANLYKPYRVVRDLSRRLATDPKVGGASLVLAWWIVWLASGIPAAVLGRLTPPDDLDGLRGWFAANAAIEALVIGAAVLAIAVVLRVQSLADARATAR